MNELKVITAYNDVNTFENDVNGWCCNCDYQIMSCEAIVVEDGRIMYIAFLGK